MLQVLRVRAYRHLFTAQIVALLGTGLLTVALGLLAFELAGSAAGGVLGTALTIKMLAYVFVAPVMATLVEHLPTRAVLVAADAVRAAVALMLPFIDQAWQIYVLVFVLQAASATFTPTFQSTIPLILPKERDYTRALSLSRLAYDFESLLSPLIAAALLTVMSFHALFAGTAAGFVVSAVLVLATTLPAREPTTPSGHFLARTTLGVRVFLRQPSLRGLLALNLVVASASAVVLVNTVVYALDVFGGTSADVAVALAYYGAGSMLVALGAPWLLERISDRRLMLTGAWILPAGLIVAALITVSSGSWILLLVVWAVLGAGTSLIITPSARLLRRAATEGTRAHLYTAQFSLSHACFLLTYPLAGWAGVLVGQSQAALLLAVLATLGTIAATKLWPKTVNPMDKLGTIP